MQKIDYIHLDSFNSIDTNGDSFDTTFNFNQKYKNINKIYLKNCEIPLGFVNIRTSNNSNVLRFILNGITYNCSINQQNYSTKLSVITALKCININCYNINWFYISIFGYNW